MKRVNINSAGTTYDSYLLDGYIEYSPIYIIWRKIWLGLMFNKINKL